MPQITDLHQHLSEAASLGRVVSGIHPVRKCGYQEGASGSYKGHRGGVRRPGFRRHTFWNTVLVVLFFRFYLKSRQSSFQ